MSSPDLPGSLRAVPEVASKNTAVSRLASEKLTTPGLSETIKHINLSLVSTNAFASMLEQNRATLAALNATMAQLASEMAPAARLPELDGLTAAMAPSISQWAASIKMPRIEPILPQYFTDMLANIRPIELPRAHTEQLSALSRRMAPELSQVLVQHRALRPSAFAGLSDAIKAVAIPSSIFRALQVSLEQYPGIEAFRLLAEQHRKTLDGYFSDLVRTAKRSSIPPNLHAHLDLDWAIAEKILLEEGIPLAWVPASDVVGQLLNADSPAARRKIISNRWRGITRTCLDTASRATAPSARVREFQKFAQQAATALLDGHYGPSQTMSANLLDTMCRHAFDNKSRNRITSAKYDLDIDEYSTELALVYGGLRGAFSEFWPHKGEPIPRLFSRHASAHGVSGRQISRVNAVIALMHAVSLLQLISRMPEPGALTDTVLATAA